MAASEDVRQIFSKWDHLSEAIVEEKEDEKFYRNQSSFLKAIQNSLDSPSPLLQSKMGCNDDFESVFSQLDSHIGATIDHNNGSEEALKPAKNKLFEWTKYFPIEELKVLLMSTSPSYKGSGGPGISKMELNASGLAYQPLDKNNSTHHFQQLIKAIKKDNPLFIDFDDYNLNSWIEQRVLLLNCYTSGELVKVPNISVNNNNNDEKEDKKELNCHGTWLKITRALVDYIWRNNPNVIFILVGPAVHERIFENFLKEVDKDKERIILVANPMTHKRTGDTWEFGEGLDVCNWKLKKNLGIQASIDWTNLSRWSNSPSAGGGRSGDPQKRSKMVPSSAAADPKTRVLSQSSIFKSAVIPDGGAYLNQKSFFDAIQTMLDTQPQLFDNKTFPDILTELDTQLGSSSAPQDIRPTKDKLFEWTKAVPIQNVKVVIIGHCPESAKKHTVYVHEDDSIRVTWDHIEATGLAYQPHDKNNIGEGFKGLIECIKMHNPLFLEFDDYRLDTWIRQNVLLLNCYTSGFLMGSKNSTRDWADRPEIQCHEAWLNITKAVVSHIFSNNKTSCFILAGEVVAEKLDDSFWDSLIQKMESDVEETDAVNNNKARVIKVNQPLWKNYYKDGKPFALGLAECNKFLEEREGKEGCINWLNLRRW